MIATLRQKIAASFGRLLSPANLAAEAADAPYQALMRDGVCVVPSCMPDDARLAAIDLFKTRHRDLIVRNLDEFGHLYRVVNLHLAIDAFADLFAQETIALAVCDRFLGASTSLYTSLYFERGSEQDLHRDTPYFCTRPSGRYLGMWLALDDVGPDNGPLRVVRGSHALPPVDVRAMAKSLFPDPSAAPASSNEGWVCYQRAVQRQCQDRGMATDTLYVSAGDVVIWHPEMLHGGAPHLRRELPRRSLVMHVTPVGTPVYHMDVFFNQDKRVSDKSELDYLRRGRRSIAQFADVDFGHQFSVPARDLR